MPTASAHYLAGQIKRKRSASSARFRVFLFGMQLAVFVGVVSGTQAGNCTALADAKGSKASCLGIGPIVGKCIKMAEDAGLIKENEVGITGLTFGISGKDDGRITQVVAGSAGADYSDQWEADKADTGDDRCGEDVWRARGGDRHQDPARRQRAGI
jgi:hypothetical protein